MPQIQNVEFKQLSVDLIDEDPHQPRSIANTEIDKDRLKVSLRALGMQQPLAVTKLPNGRFKIIDGHRRFRCVRLLREELAQKGSQGWETVPCRIYPELEVGELERIRFEIQNNRRPWKPLERAVALSRIKQSTVTKSNQEVAELLFISPTQVSNALKISEQSDPYQALMEELDLHISYRTEFVKLLPKLRPIREYSLDTVVKKIFDKVRYKQATSAKDLRTLGRIFLRATANTEHLYEFLTNQDITVKALEDSTIQPGFPLWLEEIITKVKSNEKRKIPFTSREKALLSELKKLLDKTFSE